MHKSGGNLALKDGSGKKTERFEMDRLLNFHNEVREMWQSHYGQVYSTVSWVNELASFAEQNVIQCKSANDVSGKKMENGASMGQNIYRTSSSNMTMPEYGFYE